MSIFDRTFHPDEANQAFTAGRLLETGVYRYNPQDHHGPTLYYSAAALQKAYGNGSTATLDGTLLRCTPLLFAALALVLGFFAVKKVTARAGYGIIFSLLLGTAPIFAFFATDFIQEMLLAAFTVMMFWSGVGYVFSASMIASGPTPAASRIKPGTWALLFGIAAGLAFATKETAVLAFAAAGIACIAVYHPRCGFTIVPLHAMLAAAGFMLTATLLYSSFGADWQGVYSAFIAAPLSYLGRAAGSSASQGAAAHVHPWWQYLKWLFAQSWPCGEAVLIVPVAIAAFCRGSMRHRPLKFAVVYSLALAALYSTIPYKTPWCALQIVLGLALAATFAIQLLSETACRLHPFRRCAGCAAAVLCGIAVSVHMCGLSMINRDPDSKAIPYNYAAASPQVRELAALVLSKIPPGDGSFAAVALPPEDTWPLPFYLRSVGDRVGYWTQFGELEALAGLGSRPAVVVVPAEDGHLVQPLFPHLKNTKRFEMRPRVRVRAFW